MRTQLATLTAVLLLPIGAQAAGDTGAGYVDLYFIPSSKLELTVPGFGSGSDSGSGFGVKGMVPAAENVAITAEYQSTSYDDDVDVDQLRFGVGFTGPTGSGLFIEYIDADLFGLATDGFGLHARLASGAFYGQLGYLSIEDDFEKNTGIEFAVGAAFPFSDTMGGFVDLRRTAVQGEDSEIEIELTDIRAGLRVSF